MAYKSLFKPIAREAQQQFINEHTPLEEGFTPNAAVAAGNPAGAITQAAVQPQQPAVQPQPGPAQPTAPQQPAPQQNPGLQFMQQLIQGATQLLQQRNPAALQNPYWQAFAKQPTAANLAILCAQAPNMAQQGQAQQTQQPAQPQQPVQATAQPAAPAQPQQPVQVSESDKMMYASIFGRLFEEDENPVEKKEEDKPEEKKDEKPAENPAEKKDDKPAEEPKKEEKPAEDSKPSSDGGNGGGSNPAPEKTDDGAKQEAGKTEVPNKAEVSEPAKVPEGGKENTNTEKPEKVGNENIDVNFGKVPSDNPFEYNGELKYDKAYDSPEFPAKEREQGITPTSPEPFNPEHPKLKDMSTGSTIGNTVSKKDGETVDDGAKPDAPKEDKPEDGEKKDEKPAEDSDKDEKKDDKKDEKPAEDISEKISESYTTDFDDFMNESVSDDLIDTVIMEFMQVTDDPDVPSISELTDFISENYPALLADEGTLDLIIRKLESVAGSIREEEDGSDEDFDDLHIDDDPDHDPDEELDESKK